MTLSPLPDRLSVTEPDTQRGHHLIVGASSGIGLELAKRLSQVGRVTAMARRIERITDLGNSDITATACDVTQLDSISALVEEAVAARGKLDSLIYCAGKQLIKPMRILKATEIEEIVVVNLTAATVFAKMFASAKIANANAAFCAISSIAGQRPEPAIIPYSVAKAGLDALVKGLACECGPKRAFGIAPGWLDTEMTQSYPQIYNEAFRENLARKSPAGPASVATVVDMIEYLLSPKAAHVTGIVVTVDGGASL
jgi:NAD(P)-dependent dehydrogenase (short-subunit alcohol dehydrogenase family)